MDSAGLGISASIAQRAHLSPQQLAVFESEMTKRRKSVALAYILLIFLGGLGVHRLYLGAPYSKLGVAQLVCFIVGILTVWLFIGFIPLFFTGIVSLIDLFTTVGMTNGANERTEREIMAALPVLVPA